MDVPKVSVCMITYNHERYIGQAVQSVLDQQTNFPIEIVIGEDCSTDDTRGVLQMLASRYPGTIRLLLAEENMGGKRNFMRTFAECRGKYVNILEGDDYWTCPHKLQIQVDALDARPDWAMCFHPAEVIHENWRLPSSQWPLRWDSVESSLADLMSQDFIPTNAVLFRNRLFGDFPPWFERVQNGDWALHMLNAQHGNIGFLPQVMSVYRVHSKGEWSSMDPAQKWRELFNTMTLVDHHFQGKFAAIIEQVRIHILNLAIEDARSTKVELAALKATCQRLIVENEHYRRSFTHRLTREAARRVKQFWARFSPRTKVQQATSHAA